MAERIFYKDFHFLDEPLIKRQAKIAAKSESEANRKLTQEKASKETANFEESKETKKQVIPLFSNQKDESNQDRKLSKLRVPPSKQDRAERTEREPAHERERERDRDKPAGADANKNKSSTSSTPCLTPSSHSL